MTALRTLTVLNLLMVGVSVVVAARISRATIREASLLILLSGLGLANCLRFGQVYIALSLCIMLGFLLQREGKPTLAGIAFGCMIPVKYFPVVFILYYAAKREWRVVISALVTATVVVLVSLVVLGWDIHREFLLTVAGEHLGGTLTLQDPFSPTFQSFDSLFRGLFVRDATFNPGPVWDMPVLYPLLKGVVAAAVIGVTAWIVRLRLRAPGSGLDGPGVALMTVAALLLSPAGATYHMLLLWLPVVLAWSWVEVRRSYPLVHWGIPSVYAAMGFLPYSFFARFDRHGLMSIIAYPRLWLLTVIFAFTAWAARGGLSDVFVADETRRRE